MAIDLAAPEPLWSTADNWRPSRVAGGTPGLPEPPAFTNVRVTAEGLLLVDLVGLDGAVGLWFSEDLNAWTPCDPSAWSQTSALLTIDLQHPSLPGLGRCFFQVRLLDRSPMTLMRPIRLNSCDVPIPTFSHDEKFGLGEVNQSQYIKSFQVQEDTL